MRHEENIRRELTGYIFPAAPLFYAPYVSAKALCLPPLRYASVASHTLLFRRAFISPPQDGCGDMQRWKRRDC